MEDIEVASAKCDAAKVTFEDARQNGLKWQKYVRALGVATVVSTIVLLAAATLIIFGVAGLETNVGAAVGAVATVITGAGFLFVTRQSKAAQALRVSAQKDIAKYCGDEALSQTL